MAEGVDADALAAQPPVGDPALDAMAVHPRVQQLPGRDPTALSCGDPRERGS